MYLDMSGAGCSMRDLSFWCLDSQVEVLGLHSCGSPAKLLCGK